MVDSIGAGRVVRIAEDEVFTRLDNQESASGPVRLAGALLRGPGGVLRDISLSHGLLHHAASLFALTAAFAGAYGAVIGLHQPGLQTLYAALKVPIVVLGSALLCTPTLFVFNAVGGSRLTLSQILCLVLAMSAAISLMLVAFAPIAWFFGVSTNGIGFLTFLHVGVFVIAAGFGLRMMDLARRYLRHLDGTEAIGPILLLFWCGLVVVVGLQMAHYVRPIMTPGPFFTGERGLFLEVLVPAHLR